MILTENHRDIASSGDGGVHDIESDADINALLLAYKNGIFSAIGGSKCLIPVFQLARIDLDASGSHHREFLGPEIMPALIIRSVRNPGIKAGLDEIPPLCGTNRFSQLGDVVIWEGVTEGCLCRPVEVLTVEESNRIFDCGLFWQKK